MESYLRVVWQAVLVFPFAAALIALPFLIHHYRKYGSMTFARFFLSYSFVLYRYWFQWKCSYIPFQAA